ASLAAVTPRGATGQSSRGSQPQVRTQAANIPVPAYIPFSFKKITGKGYVKAKSKLNGKKCKFSPVGIKISSTKRKHRKKVNGTFPKVFYVKYADFNKNSKKKVIPVYIYLDSKGKTRINTMLVKKGLYKASK
ncbi:hypothetical protein ACFL56_02135, partial [Candidatus Margulisiibacteriota bacterium]